MLYDNQKLLSKDNNQGGSTRRSASRWVGVGPQAPRQCPEASATGRHRPCR